MVAIKLSEIIHKILTNLSGTRGGYPRGENPPWAVVDPYDHALLSGPIWRSNSVRATVKRSEITQLFFAA